MAYSAKTREQELEEQVEHLQFRLDQLLGVYVNRPRIGITPCSFRVTHMIAERSPNTVRNEALFYAITDRPEQKLNPNNDLKVHITRARQVLRPYGIEIETDWGFGYRMTPESKAKWQKLVEEANTPTHKQKEGV